LFERVQVAKRIAKDVSSLGLDNLPLSLGLFGGWGSGKTTILRWIKEDLEEQDKNICIYVSARIPGGNILEPVLRKLSKLRGAKSESQIKRLGSKLLSILPALSVSVPGIPVQLSVKEIAGIIKKSI